MNRLLPFISLAPRGLATRSGAVRHFICVGLVAGVLGTMSSTASAEPPADVPEQLRAGAAAVDITPQELPVLVNGGMLERKATEVVDPIFVRALVLDNGTRQIALAVVDSCVLPGALIDEAKTKAAKETGVPASAMLVSATHCHSAPSVCSVLGTDVDEAYARFLPDRIAEAIVAAHRRLAPARIGWAVGEDPENVFCRRFLMKPGTAATNPFSGTENDRAQMNPGYQNPNAVSRTGPVDDDVSIIAVQTHDGRPIALYGNYSTHYAGAPPISADYFGVFCQRIGELIDAGPEFVALMSNGTSGDANCCDFLNPPRDFDRFSVGKDVAQAAYAAYQTIEYHDWVPLVVEQKTLTLGVRKPSAEEVARAREHLAAIQDNRLRSIADVYARETVLLDQWPDTRDVNLQVIRIGSLGIAAIPNEVYGSTGLKIKAESPLQPTINVSLANGYFGYLPPPDQFRLGGYTTWRARSSFLEAEAEPKITAAVLELLEAAAAERHDSS